MSTSIDATTALERAYDDLAKVVASLDASQLALPTCCPDWDVKALLNHILGGGLMYAAVNAGEIASEDAGDVVGDDPMRSDRRGREHQPRLVARCGRSRRRAHLSMGDLPRDSGPGHQRERGRGARVGHRAGNGPSGKPRHRRRHGRLRLLPARATRRVPRPWCLRCRGRSRGRCADDRSPSRLPRA